jgi:hypothetical protein
MYISVFSALCLTKTVTAVTKFCDIHNVTGTRALTPRTGRLVMQVDVGL